VTGWAARRGPVPGVGAGLFRAASLRTQWAPFNALGSPVECRVRDGAGVDVVAAGTADDEGLAPFPGHEGRPRWLARPGRAELGEFGDVVDCHRGAVVAQLAPPPAEPVDQLLARGWTGTGAGSLMTARLSRLRTIPPNRAIRSFLPFRWSRASKQVRGPSRQGRQRRRLRRPGLPPRSLTRPPARRTGRYRGREQAQAHPKPGQPHLQDPQSNRLRSPADTGKAGPGARSHRLFVTAREASRPAFLLRWSTAAEVGPMCRSARGRTRCRAGPCRPRTSPCPEPASARLPPRRARSHAPHRP
jgi:hypothetical protein